MLYRLIFALLSVIFLNTSCNTYKAAVLSSEQFEHGVIRVEPGWRSSSRARMIESNLSQQQDWLRQYNKEQRTDYVLLKNQPDGRIVIGPQKTINTIRSQLKELENSLIKEDANLTLAIVKNWKTKLRNEFLFLPEVELNTLFERITVYENSIANKELLSKIPLIEKTQTLSSITSAKERYSSLYSMASEEAKTKFDRAINQIENQLVLKLIKNDKAKIQVLPNDLTGLASINTYLTDFDSQYKSFIDNDHVIEFQKWISQKVETILKLHEKSFSATIDKASDIKSLVVLESTYFRGIAKLGSQEVGNVIKRILQRRSEIEDDLIVKRLADIQIKKKKINRLVAQYDELENNALRKAGFIFSTKGISNRELFINFLIGNFNSIPFSREDLIFLITIHKFRNEYAKTCGYALPANKVQIIEKVCINESYTEDRWGNKNNRRCLKWADQPTALYATQELNSAVQLVHSNDRFISLGFYLDEMLTGSSINNVRMISIQSDIALLLQSNDCNSKALKRFEENLIRYAIGSEPIVLTIVAE